MYCRTLISLLNGIYIKGGLRLFCGLWSENAALFERLMKIHSNPPILYYGFNSGMLVYCFMEHQVLKH